MTEDPRHKLSLSTQLEDAQKSCCPCRLCGGAAVIKDAGPGFGYFIYCENSYATSNPSCLQAGVAIRAWAYACSELWNKLNKPVAEVARLSHAHAEERKLAEAVESAFFEGFSEGRDGTWVEGDPTPAWKKSESHAALTNHAARRKEQTLAKHGSKA